MILTRLGKKPPHIEGRSLLISTFSCASLGDVGPMKHRSVSRLGGAGAGAGAGARLGNF